MPAMPLVEVDARPTLNRRAAKKSKTRADLIAAAAALFGEVGYDEVTTTRIADTADVSQRTFFRYFPTKEAVLYGDMDETLDELRAALAARPDDEAPFESVRAAILGLRDNFARHRELRLLQARLAATYPSVSAYSRATVQMSWEREIIAALAERLDVDPLDDPRPEITAGAVMSAIRVATRQWSTQRGLPDYVDLIDAALAAVPSLSDDTPA